PSSITILQGSKIADADTLLKKALLGSIIELRMNFSGNPDWLTHYRALARYNSWMNRKLFELAWDLDDSERRRDLNAFFKSIHGTLNHLIVTDTIWLRRFAAHSRDFKSLEGY